MGESTDELLAAVREAVCQSRELRAALASTRKDSGELRRQARELVAASQRSRAETQRTSVATQSITSNFRAAWPPLAHV